MLKPLRYTGILLLCISFNLLVGQSSIDSLWRLSDTIKGEDDRISAILQTAYDLRPTDAATGVKLVEKLLESDLYQSSDKSKSAPYYYLGDLQQIAGLYEEAEESIMHHISLWENTEREKEELARAYYVLSNMSLHHSDYEKTIDLSLKSQENYEKVGDTIMFIKAATNTGRALSNAGRAEDALDLYQELLTYEINDHGLRGNLFNAIGVMYDNQGEIDSSFKYNKLYREEIMQTPNLPNQFIATYNLVRSYSSINKFDTALILSEEGIAIARKSQVPIIQPYAILSKVGVLIELKRVREAEVLLASLSEYTVNPEHEFVIIEAKYKIAKNKGDYREALAALETYKVMGDSLKNVEITTKANELQLKYDTAKKEQEIKELALQNELKNQRVKTQNIALIGSGIGLMILGFFLWNSFRQRNKIKKQNTIISEALKEKELLLKEIHHRVKNNLQMVSSLLSLQSRSMESESATKALEDGQQRVQSMALIHQHLYKNEKVTAVNMKNYLSDLCRNVFTSHNINNDNISLDLDIDEIDLDITTVVPLGLVFNELITNACKYAFNENQPGILQVMLKEKDDLLIASVMDNGKGMIENPVEGFGSKLIHTFAKKLGAAVEIDTRQGYHYKLKIEDYK